MTAKDLENALLEIAKQFIEQGPGYSQESVVLREAAQRLDIGPDLRAQQRLLNVWQELFRNRVLAWGYDLDNPSAPFFHLAQ